MTDRDDERPSTNRSNGRMAAQTPSEPDGRSRRTASAEGLSAIEDALLPTRAREQAKPRENVTPLPRPAQRQQPRPKPEAPLPQPPRPKQEQPAPPPPVPRPAQKPRAVQSPETVEEHVTARPARSPEAPILRSDYRAPRAQEPGFLGAVVAIVSMVAVLVGLAVAYFLLRKH